ncbi:MAG TPA: S4 domain-containing protein, partial [Vicinamibacterales bacterium]|nr:S4 domain-containing protein [Vicinamibacterales bacterium]
MGIDLVVNSESNGQRLDRYLVSVLAEYSRSQIQKLIADGHVSVRRALPMRSGSSAARNVEARANLQIHEGDQVNVN